MFFSKSKLILIFTICLLALVSVSQTKNYPRNRDRVDTELHPWGGDDNFNPDQVDRDPDLAPPTVVVGTKTHRSLVMSLWNYMVFQVRIVYHDYIRPDITTTTIGGSGTSSTEGGK